MISLRESFGRALVSLANEYPFYVLDADVAGGTGVNYFRDIYSDRFIQCGIAEQNMMSVASGMASCGLIPIVTAYGVFATLRPLDQIRNSIAYPKMNVKIIASHLGLDVGPDGATHQAIEDLSIMRSLPNMLVISPCDDIELKQAFESLIKYKGPVYMRSGRSPTPDVHTKDYKFELGKADIIKEFSSAKITIIATGVMVARAITAVGDRHVNIVNIHTIKPLDSETILRLAKISEVIITCEDHSIIGGLGSAVAEILSENAIPTKLHRIGLRDVFGASGEPYDLAVKYGIDELSIKKVLLDYEK